MLSNTCVMIRSLLSGHFCTAAHTYIKMVKTIHGIIKKERKKPGGVTTVCQPGITLVT